MSSEMKSDVNVLTDTNPYDMLYHHEYEYYERNEYDGNN